MDSVGNSTRWTCSFRLLDRREVPGLNTWQERLGDVTLLSREKRGLRLRQLRNAEATLQFATALVRRVQDFEPGRAATRARQAFRAEAGIG